MTQQKHTFQDISQPSFIQPQSRHTLRPKGHVSPSIRRKASSKTSHLQRKHSKSLVEQALDLAAELPPLPDDWDYKDALADAIQQRFGMVSV